MNKYLNIDDDITFSDIMIDILGNSRKSSRLLAEKLASNGYAISQRTIQRYRKGTLIPSFGNALAIFEISGLNGYSEKEILNILNNSRKTKEINLENDTYVIDRRCVIPEDSFNLGDNISNGSVGDLIDNRIVELYGKSRGTFSLYMKNLIELDLKEHVLKGEDK